MDPNRYENLLLLCRAHHRLIDSQPDAYTVEELEQWKREHEGPQPISRHAAVSPPPISTRYRRRQEFARLVEELEPGAIIVLSGLAGTGKSQLAADVFRSLVDDFALRLWVRARDPETLEADFATVGPYVGPRRSEAESGRDYCARVREALEQSDGWLVVFDDALDAGSIDHLVPRGNGVVLITSQSAAWSGEVFGVGPLSSEDAHLLLATNATLEGASTEVRDEIVRITGALPLSLVQVCGYVEATGITAGRALRLLEERSAELLSRGTPPDHEPIFASIARAVDELDQPSRSLLGALAYLAPVAFPLPPFRTRPPDDEPFPVLADELRFEDAVADLRRFSLIERDDQSLVIHSLTQEVVRSSLGSSDRRNAILMAIFLVASQLPERVDRVDHLPAALALLPHANALVGHSAEIEAAGSFVAGLLSRLSSAHRLSGDSASAERDLEAALRLVGDADQLTRASILHNLSNCAADRGELTEAVDLGRQALEIKQAESADPVLVAFSMQSLGRHLEVVGSLDEALELHREAVRLLENAPDSAPRDLVDAHVDLGRVLRRLGSVDESMDELKRAYEISVSDAESWSECVDACIQLSLLSEGTPDSFRYAEEAVRAAESAGVPSPSLAQARALRGRLLVDERRMVPEGIADLRSAAGLVEAFEGRSVNFARTLGNLGGALVTLGLQSGETKLSGEGLGLLEESLNLLESGFPMEHETIEIARGMLERARDAVWGDAATSFPSISPDFGPRR